MQTLLKWLRGLGPIGSYLADAITLLFNNWVLTMSTVAGLWASLTDSVVTLAANPRVHTAILVFLTVLWTSVGITYLVDRRRARVVKPEHDYRYGLTFENLVPMYEGPDGPLSFGVTLKNYSSGPIRYTIDLFDIRLGSRASPKLQKGALTSFMPRGGGRTSMVVAFSKDDIRDFMGKRIDGTVTFSIVYGHPELEPVRRLSMELGIVVGLRLQPDPMEFGMNIKDESDVAVV